MITAPDGTGHPTKYITVWARDAAGNVRFLTDGGGPRPRSR